MTDAPERIWADGGECFDRPDDLRMFGRGLEYARADLLQSARREAREQALEDAVREVLLVCHRARSRRLIDPTAGLVAALFDETATAIRALREPAAAPAWVDE